MGTIEEVLKLVATDDLGVLLRENGIAPPKSYKDRIDTTADALASGRLNLDVVLDITKGQKAWLIEMCDAAEIDSLGTIPVLRERLNAWYGKTYRRDGALTAVLRKAVDAVSGGDAQAPSSTANVPSPEPQSRPLAQILRAERQFIQVRSRPEGMVGGGLRFLSQVGGATKVMPVLTAELVGGSFDRGHPQDGVIYALDPFADDHYIPADFAAQKIAEQKISALTVIAACLGATRLEVVEVRSQGRATSVSGEIDAMGKEVGLSRALSESRTTTDRIGVEWASSEPRPIPQKYVPYLSSIPGLQELADMVFVAGKQPSNVQRNITMDFRESQDIALKVSKIAALGAAAAKSAGQAFVSSTWTFGIWFGQGQQQAQSAPSPMYTPPAGVPVVGSGPILAPPGAPCPTCQAGLAWVPQYQRWYCYHCQRYA